MDNLKMQLQEDINKLIEQVRRERQNIGYKMETNDGIKTVTRNQNYDKVNKNYSEYRKLIHSLFDLFNAYVKLNTPCNDDFVKKFKDELVKELDEVHLLMQDSLKRQNNEQYRCLNSVYVMLIEELNRFEDRKPKEAIKINIDAALVTDNKKELERLCLKLNESKEIVNKCICLECNKSQVLNQSNFYKKINSQEYNITMCKTCAKKYVLQSEGHLLDYLSKADIVFIRRVWNKSNNDLSEYIKNLYFDLNRGKRFKDSKFI